MSELSPAIEHREELHAQTRAATLAAMMSLRQDAEAGLLDADEKIKLARLGVEILGLKEEKKADPNAGLPVFHITINGSGVQIEQAKPLEIVEQVQPPAPPALPDEVSPAVAAGAAVNTDLEDLDSALRELSTLFD